MTRAPLLAAAALLAAACGRALPAQPEPAAPAAPARDQAQAARFYLDYDVPESPAFAALGVTPAHVLRAAAAKPLVASLLGQVARGERLGSGVAIDVAPYGYVGRFRNVREYQRSRSKRFLANLLVSLATLQRDDESDALAFAAGVRAALRDDHDLLRDSLLTDSIGARLVPERIECPKIPGTNLCVPGTAATEREIDLAPVYAAARERVARRPGWAAAVGAAYGGTLRGGVARTDSLQERTARGWVSLTRYLGGGQELLATAQWVRDTAGTDHLRAGSALRLQSGSSAVAAELAYDSEGGGVLPGLNAELRLLQRVTLIAAILAEPAAGGAPKRVRFQTAVRWAATEGF